MPKLELINMGGKLPKVDPTLLPEQFAQTATNCDFRSGKLKPIKEPLPGDVLTGTPRGIWKKGSDFITFPTEVSVVNSQIAETNDRFYYTGDGYPKKSDSVIWDSTRYLGVAPPAAAPIVTINGTGDGSTQDVISYVYTIVTEWGEESAPSPETAVFTIEGNQTIELSSLAVPATVGGAEKFRFYRLSSSESSNAEYLYVDEIEISLSGYVWDDDNGSNALKACSTEVLPVEDWDAPPDDLAGLIQVHNGMVVGFTGKQLFVSEPFIPYAFPEKYALPFDTDIQGIGYSNQTIIVVTKTQVYRVTGASPETLYAETTGFKQTCVSTSGFATTPYGVCFPSEEGLCFTDGTGVEVLTAEWISSEQWQALNPSNIKATFYNGKYFAVLKGTATGFTVDLKTGELVDIDLAPTLTAIYDFYHDPEEDEIILLAYNSSAQYRLYTFAGGSGNLTFTWKSKKFRDSENYNRCKIAGESGTVLFIFYLEGEQVQSKSVPLNSTFRLPARGYHIDKEFQLTGDATITRIQLGTSAKEIV